MQLFSITKTKLSTINQKNFSLEKDLQNLIEQNLESVFGCRVVASEFSTGIRHAGRIDTLALSEENNPVLIEYKKKASSELITQSLFYLDWMQDHQGDFEIEVQKSLGKQTRVDWSNIRVICLAPNYSKYDLHAAQAIGTSLELWIYRLFENNSLYLEEVLQKSITTSHNPPELTAGKKAALPRKTGSYTVEQHFRNKPTLIQELAQSISEFILSLDSTIEEVPKKHYIAYKMSQNITCIQLRRERLRLFVKLNPKQVEAPKQLNPRDMRKTGHPGTGDLELSVRDPEDLELVKPLLEQAYQKMGG